MKGRDKYMKVTCPDQLYNVSVTLFSDSKTCRTIPSLSMWIMRMAWALSRINHYGALWF